MNFIAEIFEFGALQIQPTTIGDQKALVSALAAIFSPHPPPLCMGSPGSFNQGR